MSLKQIGVEEGIIGEIKLSSLLRKYNVTSLKDLVVAREHSGSSQEFSIFFTGLHAFGITDGPGDDEPFVVVGVNDFQPVGDKVAGNTTVRKFPTDGVYDNPSFSKGSQVSDMQLVWKGKFTARFISITCTVWEFDSGDPQEVKQAVEKALLATAAAAATALTATGVGAPIGLAVAALLAAAAKFLGPEIVDLLPIGCKMVGHQEIVIEKDNFPNLKVNPFKVNNFGSIKFTHETQSITGMGATYKGYFRIVAED